MRRVWIVAQRELKALFDYPTAYVLLGCFWVSMPLSFSARHT